MARYGDMSWEVYCFIHGLPTRNCGSWLPGRNLPLCGRTACAELAKKMPRDSGKLTWPERALLECKSCQEHRRKRCWIIQENAKNEARYMEEPFVEAPYVHPFRQPSLHAQQLRAMYFANARGRRIMWMKAWDRPCQKEKRPQTEKSQTRK